MVTPKYKKFQDSEILFESKNDIYYYKFVYSFNSEKKRVLFFKKSKNKGAVKNVNMTDFIEELNFYLKKSI